MVVYLLALEEHGLDKVHERVGREPSGRNLNDLILDHRKLPYNPLVNSGAILCTALIRASLPLADVRWPRARIGRRSTAPVADAGRHQGAADTLTPPLAAFRVREWRL